MIRNTFIKFYFKLINNFWKIVLLKIAKLAASSIDYTPAIQICINCLNDINLLNINLFVFAVISSVPTYIYYKLYLEHCDQKEVVYKTLKNCHREIARFNLMAGAHVIPQIPNLSDEELAPRNKLIDKVKRWTYYLNLTKERINDDMIFMFLNYLLCCMSLVGLSITYDSEKLIKAYSVAKRWREAIATVKDPIFQNKLFKK